MFIKDYNKTAIIFKDKTLSYNELKKSISYYTSLYSINENDRVIIFSENRPEWIFSFYSVWYKNGINIAVDSMSSSEELQYILLDSKPKVVFCSNINNSLAKDSISATGLDIKLINIDEITVPDDFTKKLDENTINSDTDRIAIIVYTSGTTGKPKGVMLSHKNISANIDGILGLNMFNGNDILGVILPFHHIYPLTGTVVFPFSTGMSIVIIDKLSSDAILTAFQTHRMTILFGIPRLYSLFHKAIMDKINKGFATKLIFGLMKIIKSKHLSKIVFKKVHKLFGGNIRYFLSGGSKLSTQVDCDFRILGFNITEGYGLSETSPLNTANNYPGVYKKGSIGKPLINVEVKIVDSEIVVRGDNVMKGYLNKPAETLEVIKDGWFYTGDSGFIDKKGFIFITGRKRELLVLPNGKKINPEEIENKIAEISPDIVKEIGVFLKDNHLYALVRPDMDRMKKEYLVNILETIKWQVIDKYNKISRDFKKVLDFKVISEELPKTRVGKLKRFLFPKIAEKSEEKITHEPDMDCEEFDILKKYLQSNQNTDVYSDSHLELDLGLDSLAKIELQSYIENTFGFDLSNDDLSSNLILSDLVKHISLKKVKIESEETNWDQILNHETDKKIKSKSFLVLISKFHLFIFSKIWIRLSINRSSMPDSPIIFAPNHLSYIDSFIITAAMPRKYLKKTFFIANKKHFEKGINKFFAQQINLLTLDINKNLKHSLQEISSVLRAGYNVVIFPEGNRSRDGELKDFKKTFAILSKTLNIPVVPITIKGADKALPVSKFFIRPYKVSVDFCEHVKPDNKSYDEITESVRDIIYKKLSEK